MITPKLCYLCGMPLSKPTSVDHVPPLQLYSAEIRRTHNPNLLTIRVHRDCNTAYQHDEDYFVQTLMPFAIGSYAGSSFYREAVEKFRRGRVANLMRKVLREFDRTPSGIILPAGKVAKRFEGARLSRVATKIVRGLHFHHEGKWLPPDMPTSVSVTAPGETPPDHFLEFMVLQDNPARGKYPGVFDYRFRSGADDDMRWHYWALLLWDRVIITVVFHDPECGCAECEALAQAHGPEEQAER